MRVNPMENQDSPADRQTWISVLSTSPVDHLDALWAGMEDVPDYVFLRSPEIGLVMVRGRIGGTGGPFNMGEATVTRCSVRLKDPACIGYSCLAGRDRRKAEIAAVLDAMLQAPDRWPGLYKAVIDPLLSTRAQRDRDRASKVSATRVDFFTMVRGED